MLPRGLLKTHATALTWLIESIDLLFFIFAGLLSFFLRFNHWQLNHNYVVAIIFAALLLIPVFRFFGIYRSLRGKWFLAHLGSLYLTIAVVMLLLAAATFLTKTGSQYSRLWYLYWALIAAVLLTLFRIGVRIILRIMRKNDWNVRRVVIFGSDGSSKELAKRVRLASWSGFRIVSILDDGAQSHKVPKDLCRYLAKLNADELWITMLMRDEKRVKDIIESVRHNVITIRYFPDLFALNLINHSSSEILGLTAIDIVSTPMIGVNRFVKFIEDKLLSIFILVLISPILIVLAILIKLSSHGPVFYCQERVSWNGKKFNMLKFRSMPVDTEVNSGAVWAIKGENRATKVGNFMRKTSLDELPQFINVLKGDMSIVGPRPERPVFVEQFKNEIPNYMQKHLVKAGITGWAQVNGWRGDTDLCKRIECDIYYIEHWSFWFDLKIIALTLFKGFVHKNAY